jgi:hypothetical protein
MEKIFFKFIISSTMSYIILLLITYYLFSYENTLSFFDYITLLQYNDKLEFLPRMYFLHFVLASLTIMFTSTFSFYQK